MKKVGLLGGTFDPVHLGHTAVAEEVRQRLQLDQVLLLPCHSPPHKDRSDLTPGPDRLAMIALATQENAHLVPSSFELLRPAPSFTIDTLRALQAIAPEDRLYFLMGMDSFLEIGQWKEHDALIESFHLVVFNRPGSGPMTAAASLPAGARDRIVDGPAQMETAAGRVHMLQVEEHDISSSRIRGLLRGGRSVDGLVARPVADYIQRCFLYGKK